MDSFPSKLNHEKSEKLQNLIDNLYQLKLENDDEALPKIILTDCSSNSVNNPDDSRSDASRLAQNNYANSLNHGTDDGGDNRLSNNGRFLQPHSNNLKLGNNLGVPASSNYQSEARPP